jgi:hypothetical protein
MFKLLVFGGLLSIWAHACTQTRDQSSVEAVGQSSVIKVDTATVDFDADIKPIFLAHCQPCHFTGGKMYERMPFDQAKTIIDHREGIVRRIKNPEEVEKLTAFLKQSQ